MKILILLAFIAVGCTKKEAVQKTDDIQSTAPAQENSFAPPKKQAKEDVCKVKCESFDTKICEKLMAAENLCQNKKTKEGCMGFVNSFKTALSTRVSCQNSCNDGPSLVQVTHLCDDMEPDYPKVTERSGYLIPQLKFTAAQKLIVHRDFQGIIDGAMGDLKKAVEKAKQELSSKDKK